MHPNFYCSPVNVFVLWLSGYDIQFTLSNECKIRFLKICVVKYFYIFIVLELVTIPGRICSLCLLPTIIFCDMYIKNHSDNELSLLCATHIFLFLFSIYLWELKVMDVVWRVDRKNWQKWKNRYKDHKMGQYPNFIERELWVQNLEKVVLSRTFSLRSWQFTKSKLRSNFLSGVNNSTVGTIDDDLTW